jgi:hypothetical protein
MVFRCALRVKMTLKANQSEPWLEGGISLLSIYSVDYKEKVVKGV